MKHLFDYIISLREKGEFCFTSSQALKALNVSQDALRMSLVRMRNKKQIVTLYKRFHLIIPPEYRSIGCLPADHFIFAYMKFLELDYYVCLLSAARYYGAEHQKSQIFQVMTTKQLKVVKCGKVTVQFIYKKNIKNIPINIFDVPTGYINVSTPEVTTMDLLRYQKRSGGINHIATVLTELIASIDPKKLLQLVQASDEIVWVQRLGYILEQLNPIETKNWQKSIDLLKKFVKKKSPAYTLLVNDGDDESTAKDADWKIIVNYKIESDI